MFAIGKKAIFLCLAIAVLLIAYLGPSAYRKAQMDKEVDRLCAVDGGIHVYEKVILPSSSFNQWGDPTIFFANEPLTKGSPYFLDIQSLEVKQEDSLGSLRSTISQFKASAIRRSDRKVLGELISYTRIGGDPVGPWHPSNYNGCSWSGDKALKKQVFIRSE